MRPVLTREIVKSVIAQWTGIPAERIGASEAGDEGLTGLEEKLNSAIFGQEEAVKAVAEALRRRFALRQEAASTGPIASLMFVGPSGTGKTELAKQLAVHFFGDTRKLIKINMNDFREPHTVSRLVGAPPGYVGYNQGGELTEAIRKEPFSAVLFDEVEKAHPEVVTNVLLQMMGEGVLTDMSSGALVDCSDVIVLMTGNLGNRDEGKRGIGFGHAEENHDEKHYRRRVIEAVRSAFPPEFMGRIDNIIVFNHLSEEARMRILDREVQSLAERLSASGKQPSVKIVMSELARKIFLEEARDDEAGARAVQRVFSRRIEEPCSELRMGGHLERDEPLAITVDLDDEGRFVYEVRSIAHEAEATQCETGMEGM